MSIYRIKKEDNDPKTTIEKYFDNDPDGMIIIEKDVHISADKYNIKYIDKDEKYIILGRRERNKQYKRQRINVGLLNVIDYRVNNIKHSIRILNILIVFNILLVFCNICK